MEEGLVNRRKLIPTRWVNVVCGDCTNATSTINNLEEPAVKKLAIITCLCLIFSIFAGPAMAKKKLFKLNTCWMPSHESFVPWYAKKMGWDKDEGLDMRMHYFDSGMAELEALPARSLRQCRIRPSGQPGAQGQGNQPQISKTVRYGGRRQRQNLPGDDRFFRSLCDEPLARSTWTEGNRCCDQEHGPGLHHCSF